MDKLELIPGEVRGGGNIVTSKSNLTTDENMSMDHSKLTRYTGVISGMTRPYYDLEFTGGYSIEWNPPRMAYTSVTITVRLWMTGDDTTGSTVVLKLLNDEKTATLWSETQTYNSGTLSFNVSIPSNATNLCHWRLDVKNPNSGHKKVDKSVVIVNTPYNFDLSATRDIVQTGEKDYLIATITGVGRDGTNIGIPGQTINFYEDWDEGVRVYANPNPIQSGETSEVSARLLDIEDGSFVRREGIPIKFYEQWSESVKLSIIPNITQIGNSSVLSAQLVDSTDGSLVKRQGVSVKFYEEWRERVRVTANPNIVQTGDTSSVTAQLVDANDGSLVKEAGIPIKFYEEWTPGVHASLIPSIIQNGETSEISAQIIDTSDGSFVPEEGVPVSFYKETDVPIPVYVNDGTRNDLIPDAGVAVSVYNNDSLKITTSTPGEKHARYPIIPDYNFIFECEIGARGMEQDIAMYMRNSTTNTGFWFSYNNILGEWNGALTGTTFNNYTVPLNVGDKIKIIKQEEEISLYCNNALIFKGTATWHPGIDYPIGHYTNQGREQYIKNIKIVM